MTGRAKISGPVLRATDFAEMRRPSFAIAGVGEALTLIGLVTIASGLIGYGDDDSDAIWLTACGLVVLAAGLQIGRRYARPARATPARILRGLGIIWSVACVVGAIIYLLTGSVDRIDDALLESTAGFTTTNLTSLDPTELSRGLLVWRSATQWVGGYLAILLSVVAMPEALQGTALLTRSDHDELVLVSDATRGRRRILAVYGAFSVAVTVAYLATGMSVVDAISHAMSTVSTGGFSTNADSFTGLGDGPRTVATISMLLSGASIFVLWWLVRGRLRPLWQSVELRIYLAIVAVATALIIVDVDDISTGEALFTATSIASTTGFAIGDWAAWSDDAGGVLLVVAAIGSMLGSAGGGFRVMRSHLLFRYAVREMRQQLDPRAVVVVKHRGNALDELTLHRLAGFQISHLAVMGAASLLLAASGMSVLGSVWGATSAISTLGPALGEIGSFGSVSALAAPARGVLIPVMLAGRLSIVPALVIVAWGMRGERLVGLRARRLLRATARRSGRGSSRG